MKYLVADWEEFINPGFVRYEDGGRTCGWDWQIFDYYKDANNYVIDKLTKLDNPSVSFAIVPLDADNMETVSMIPTGND